MVGEGGSRMFKHSGEVNQCESESGAVLWLDYEGAEGLSTVEGLGE
jgi:hypothetical protein